MNKRLEAIREKIKGTPAKEAFDAFLRTVEKDVHESAAQKLNEDIQGIVIEVKEILSRRDQGFRDLHAYLEFQRMELNKGFDVNEQVISRVLDGIEKLSTSLKLTQKVSVTNPNAVKLSKADIRDAFIDSLDTVQKLLQSQNELPDSVNLGYDARTKSVNRIEELYPDHRIVTSIRYDNFGNVSGWQTVRE